MLSLIKKEIFISRTYGIIALLYGSLYGFIIFSISDQMLAKTIFISMVLLISVIGYDAMMQADMKNNSSIMMCSLPIKRSHTIISKYITIGLYPMITSIIIYISMFSFKESQMSFLSTLDNIITFELVFLSISLTLIYFAINMPIYYYSMGIGKVLSKISLIFAVLLPGIISKYSQQLIASPTLGYIFGLNLKFISLIALGISLIIYIASLQLTIGIYNKKEF